MLYHTRRPGKRYWAMEQMTLKARKSGKPKLFVIACYDEESKENHKKLIKDQFPMWKFKNSEKITYNNTILKYRVSKGIQGKSIDTIIIDDPAFNLFYKPCSHD